MNARAKKILKVLLRMNGGISYTHHRMVKLVQSVLFCTDKTAIGYVEDMKRLGLLKLAGSDILVREDERYAELLEES